MKAIRNLSHYIIGFVFLYTFGNATYVNDFYEWQKIVGSILIGLIFGGTLGMFWEFGNKVFFKIQGDMNDVKRTAIGGVFGCMLACYYANIEFITFWLFYSCIILILLDLTRAVIKYNKDNKKNK